MNVPLNPYLGAVPENYLFSEVAKRVAAAKSRNPHKKIISLGIGDVTLPLPSCAVRAAVVAAEEMGREESFRGYGPESGYIFLKTAVSEHYGRQGVSISPDEIYISDGAKSTLGSIGDIIGNEKLLVPAPTYPVMPDSWLMSGREVVFLPGNPTGAAYTAEGLGKWVDYALSTGSLIVFDAAYSAFSGDGILRSVFSVKNASECAVEVGSLSKNAGFTGMRCGWLTIPENLSGIASAWNRRQATKFNGVPYIVQRAAEAALTPEGERECRTLISYYRENAAILAKILKKHSIFFTGGENSPYLFARCPGKSGSWDFFDRLLDTAGIVCTPGSGFGRCGEGWFRLSSFGNRKNVAEAAERLDRFFGT